jgi:hypothetical protein
MASIRALLVSAIGDDNATLSYQFGWPRQFAAHRDFECTSLNVIDRRWHSRGRQSLAVRRWRGDVIVLLHSVFSNACALTPVVFDAIRRRPEPKVFFIGNEYKFMPEKMRFCDELGIAMLVTQTANPQVHELYRRRLGCTVMSLPNTGLDTNLFRPTTPCAERPVDLGYRAADSPMYLGHRERREMAEFFQANAARYGLAVDISLAAADRFVEGDWAAFLNRCKGQLGTEAGGDFFELTDETRVAVSTYEREHPDASFEEVRARFFDARPPSVPMRVMSSRNIAAACTRTVQLLFEGEYDGYLKPDVHYIPVKKDFSNADESIRKFQDAPYAEEVAQNAYDLVMQEFTYDRLISRFRDALRPLL